MIKNRPTNMFQPYPKFTITILSTLLLLTLVIAACDDNSFRPREYSDIGPFNPADAKEKIEASNGLVIYIYEEGTGDVIAERQTILIHYTGRTDDGNIFDSSKYNGTDAPSSFVVEGTVKGFMQGLAGVIEDGERKHAAREGSRRTLVIPPELGYTDPSHSLYGETLTFDIEVVSIGTTN